MVEVCPIEFPALPHRRIPGHTWKVHAVAWNPKVMCFINSTERQLKLENLEGEPNDRNVLERAK